jgi:hypothetical protein
MQVVKESECEGLERRSAFENVGRKGVTIEELFVGWKLRGGMDDNNISITHG